MNEPLWSASEQRIAGSILSRFIADVGTRVGSAPSATKTSTNTRLKILGSSGPELWRFAEVKGDMGAPPYLVDAHRMPGARFFPDARLNYAENALAKRRGNTAAIVFRGEEKVRRRVTWGELRVGVAKAQAMLRKAEVKAGDRIAAILPNLPESIVCMLATASVGAVWSSCSPDFGVQGILDRFAQIAPKVLIAADGYYYNGKRIDNSDKLAAVAAQLPTVERVVVVPYLGRDAEVVEALKANFKGQPKHVERWSDVVTARSESRPRFVRLPFGHPLFILFSSGTTGMPKCIVHSAGGVLLKHICEHRLHADVNPGDRLFYFTTLGWMSENGSSPGLRPEQRCCSMTARRFIHPGTCCGTTPAAERCAHFGTSAKYIDALERRASPLAVRTICRA